MIDLQNYDEWFMMYADGELSASEMASVMAFLELHPELKPDLKFYNTLKYKADNHISFPDKSVLYHAEADATSEAYIFKPDYSIVFRDKSALYRKTPVSSMAWLKPFAVAASLIICVALYFQFEEKNIQRSSDMEVTGIQTPTGKKAIAVKSPLEVAGAIAKTTLSGIKTGEVVPLNTTNIQSTRARKDTKIPSMPETAVLNNSMPEMESVASTAEQPVVASSNLSPAVLEAAGKRMAGESVQKLPEAMLPEPKPAINTALLVADAVKEQHTPILKGILRKISRAVQHEDAEPSMKFIQVANFEIPVKQ